MTDTTREPTAPTDIGRLDFEVQGMTCGSCAVRVQRVLDRQPGVAGAEVNFATGKARVVPGGTVDVGGLQAAVERIGYHITPVGAGKAEDAEAQAEAAWRRRLTSAVAVRTPRRCRPSPNRAERGASIPSTATSAAGSLWTVRAAPGDERIACSSHGRRVTERETARASASPVPFTQAGSTE